jgi:hypothetical protein
VQGDVPEVRFRAFANDQRLDPDIDEGTAHGQRPRGAPRIPASGRQASPMMASTA